MISTTLLAILISSVADAARISMSTQRSTAFLSAGASVEARQKNSHGQDIGGVGFASEADRPDERRDR